MAVQAQYGGVAGVPGGRFHRGDLLAEDAEAKLQQYGKLLATVAANNGAYNCATRVASGAQSDLTCNNGGGGSLKRGREAEQYVSSTSALRPIPGMMMKAAVPAAADRFVESATTSTSGRPAAASSFAVDAIVSELYQQNADIDAVVRMELERMRAGVEQAPKRQCQSLVRTASAAAARRLREKEAELEAARRCTAKLEERLLQVAAETQAWCGLVRSNEAVAAGLRATLDHLLRNAPAPAPVPAEGFGESDFAFPATAADVDDAQSSCFEAKEKAGPCNYKWACKSCGEGEASVLLLPCRHLCLCKACEPTLDACPVCLAAKNASVHIAMN
ncbi:hypothetical protein ACQ4PT_032881 [Festuca glaucescens]